MHNKLQSVAGNNLTKPTQCKPEISNKRRVLMEHKELHFLVLSWDSSGGCVKAGNREQHSLPDQESAVLTLARCMGYVWCIIVLGEKPTQGQWGLLSFQWSARTRMCLQQVKYTQLQNTGSSEPSSSGWAFLRLHLCLLLCDSASPARVPPPPLLNPTGITRIGPKVCSVCPDGYCSGLGLSEASQ